MDDIDWNQFMQVSNTTTLNQVLKPTALTVGAIWLLRALYYIAIAIKVLIKVYVVPPFKPINLKKKYGSYVVMTNVTDVMSEEFAKAFARKGFSLIFITLQCKSFDAFKPQIEEILQKHGGKLKVILKDITKSDDDIYNEVEKELDDPEIKGEVGILMNNSGIVGTTPGNFLGFTNKFVLDTVHLQVIDFLMITKAVLKVMVHNHKGLIVNVTSPVNYVPFKQFGFRRSMRQFTEEFSKIIHEEFCNLPNIEIEVLNPGSIVTEEQREKYSVLYPTPSEYVKSAMPKLGRIDQTAGYWTHSLWDTFNRCLPEFIHALANWIIKLSADSNANNKPKEYDPIPSSVDTE